ncbi:hypothetical protein IQ273_28135 [Nodosilinea sp. LEGE 07298]|jgi:hypothetical protein|uniref:hypothetical protein n=1 Tax=Nodosilinea sp. LEGE 07298 TaxID=2777970 RepID=UPI0018803686|nr:hypothetical protein [Nodosilinea sp. LEGE 07298]MBE9113251.1 hypothetical protein [Nodosilinea sp. LEGE 07298]
MTSSNPSVFASSSRLSTEVMVGLLVPPVLLGIVVARALADGLTQAGLSSEQLFAGERLPNLNMPPTSPEHPTPAATD